MILMFDMRKSVKFAKKLLVGIVGFPLLFVGLILIPLPGPGVLISLLAFFILSLEFDWADQYFQKAKNVVKKIYDESKARADRISKAGD